MIDKPDNYSLENLIEMYEQGEDIADCPDELLDEVALQASGLDSIELKKFNKELVEYAKSFIGQQVSKDKLKNTFNCSTFVRFIYKELLGIDISEDGKGRGLTAKIMSSDLGKNILINEIESIDNKISFIKNNANIGDILLFHRQSLTDNTITATNFYPGHVGLYLGNGKYIDARYNRGNIEIVDINEDNYMQCFIGIKSILSTICMENHDRINIGI